MMRFMMIFGFALGALLPQDLPKDFPRLGQPAPPFSFREVVSPTGPDAPSLSDLTPAALRGKVVVLDFFATWCGPCIEAIPHTNTLVDAMRGQPVMFLAVAKEERALLEPVFKRSPLRAIVVLDAEGVTYRNYYINALPFVVILDRAGKIAAFTHPAQISQALIEKILKGS